MISNKKKSTYEEAPILRQDYGTTTEVKSEAAMLFDLIGEGIGNALKRPKDPKTDRVLRRLISDANSRGDCISNVGSGYFRPGDDDSYEFELYIAGERSRARDILRKCRRMEETYNRRYQ